MSSEQGTQHSEHGTQRSDAGKMFVRLRLSVIGSYTNAPILLWQYTALPILLPCSQCYVALHHCAVFTMLCAHTTLTIHCTLGATV